MTSFVKLFRQQRADPDIQPVSSPSRPRLRFKGAVRAVLMSVRLQQLAESPALSSSPPVSALPPSSPSPPSQSRLRFKGAVRGIQLAVRLQRLTKPEPESSSSAPAPPPPLLPPTAASSPPSLARLRFKGAVRAVQAAVRLKPRTECQPSVDLPPLPPLPAPSASPIPSPSPARLRLKGVVRAVQATVRLNRLTEWPLSSSPSLSRLRFQRAAQLVQMMQRVVRAFQEPPRLIAPAKSPIMLPTMPPPMNGQPLVRSRDFVARRQSSIDTTSTNQTELVQDITNNNGNVNYNAPNGVITNNNHVEMHVVARNRLGDDLDTIQRVLVRHHHVPRAVHDAQPAGTGCMDGTRVQLLDKAKSLVIAHGGAHMVWISGMAGTGKTSIALTLSQRLRDDTAVLLAGTFFCSRSAGEIVRADARRIVPTLATQLVRMAPACGVALAAELRKDPDIPHKSIRIQVERLLRTPLDSLTSIGKPIVFVVDALDECGNQQQLIELVDALADLRSPVQVKFIVTSRPDLRIRQSAISNPRISTHLELDSNDPAQLTEDIRLYIDMRFKHSPTTSAWYTEGDVTELAMLAGRLFVFAAVAVTYILVPTDGPRRLKRLRKVKMHKASSALTPLDAMYSLILAQATDPTVLELTELGDTRKIIAAILSSHAPLSVKTLADLLGLSPEQLRGALDELHAVIFVPKQDEEGELRTLHATFVDFLFTRAPVDVRINEAYCHAILADACLQRLTEDDLQFNISRSRFSYDLTPATDPDWVAHSLRYACLQWASHLELAVGEFDDQVDSAFRHKFLFWLELLSVIGNVGLASKLLRVAMSVARSPALSLFLRDAITFVESFQRAIELDAAHIYISALPFTPKESLVHQTYFPLFEGLLSVEISGINSRNWHEVKAAAISLNGRAIAIASSDGSIRVWDEQVREEVYSVIPDHEGEVCAVTISPDGCLIATGSMDHAVRLWDASKGRRVNLRGHRDRVGAVAFSPNGTQLASGSDDETIRVWEVQTGRQLVSMITPAPVSSISYSQDGQLIAAGYTSRYAQTFHATTGERDHTFKDPRKPDITSSGIVSLVFAPDRPFTWVASGNDILGIAFETKSTPKIVTGHTARVNVIAFSQCGRFIASGSDDTTVRLWDAKTGDSCGPVLHGHAGAVLSVAFSSTTSSIVSVGSGGIIRVWNVKNITSPGETDKRSPLECLAIARYEDGWLVTPGALDQRLLWVPPEHRGHLEISDHTWVIAGHRVILTAEAENLHLGEHWFKCWRTTN